MRIRRYVLCAMGAFVLLLALSHPWWLPGVAWYLVEADPPAPADAAVVLGGDFFGDRILRAAELARRENIPKVFVSGPFDIYGRNEADLAIDFAASKGFDRSLFVPAYIDAFSTQEEAELIVPMLRRNGIRRLAVVTSDFHTRRAGRIWRDTAGGINISVVSAPCREFRPNEWWRHRQDRKTVLIEWQKTVAVWLGGL